MEQKPTIGRIVLYRVGTDDQGLPVYRPAIIVKVWSPTLVNLQVFLDGTNDRLWKYVNGVDPLFAYEDECLKGMAWRTSIPEGEDIGNWSWPVRA